MLSYTDSMSKTSKQLIDLMDKLPESVQQQIYNYAQKTAESMGITKNGAAATRPVSFLSVAEELGLVGIISDGPRDLSTNPEHFEGFGK
jgi:hypothetical protein